MALNQIRLKRVYEPPNDADGTRVLVERLWPRGVSKATAAIDYWAKDAAPSPALRTWFAHRSERWQEFCTRYWRELKENRDGLIRLRELCNGRRVTFIFASKDELRNGAVVLKAFLENIR